MNGQTDQRAARTGVEPHAPHPSAVTPDPPTDGGSTRDRPSPVRQEDGRTLAQVPAQARRTGPGPVSRDAGGTAAGSALTDRYVLRQWIGADPGAGAEFWRAEDTVLRRPVGVTLLRRLPADDRSDDPEGTARAGEMIVRALRSGCFEHAGSARLLDVLAPGTHRLPDDVLGASVAEWVPGRSIAEVVAEGPIRAHRAARAVETLAAAATEAHQQGLVLGCDHPQRVRITPDGRALLAFLLPRPSVSAADDVRGLGAVLYCLLTRRWPLSVADSARAGLICAERSPAGRLRAPSALRPGVPVELDTLCTGALGQGEGIGRVHTAAAMHRMLADVVAEDADQAFFPPVRDGAPAEPDDVWQDSDLIADPRDDPQRRRNLRLGLTALGIGVLVVLGYLSIQLGSMFGAWSGAPPVVVLPPAASAPPAPTAAPAPPAPSVSATLVPRSVQVFDPTGDGDNAGSIDRVVDDDPSSTWRTQQYRQPFPALKDGVGIMASFDGVQPITRVSIDSVSPGTVVEIRSAPAPDAPLEQTQVLGTVTLGAGRTVVPLPDARPTGHVLLWITTLGGGGSANVSEIGEISFERAVQ